MYSWTSLTKPGIILGNAVTMAGGFALASQGGLNVFLLLTTLIGLSLVIGSACICNNYIDRTEDQKMARTNHRPLARGTISGSVALLIAFCLGVTGAVILAWTANLLALSLTAVGFFCYVVLYGRGKYLWLCGTPIGSVAGAIPPVVGYCAVTDRIDITAVLLFLTMICWQMPHFYSIAIYRFDEYAKTSFLILPIQKGSHVTKIQMMAYIASFIAAASSLSLFGCAGTIPFVTSVMGGGAWLYLCWRGFSRIDEKSWAHQMFVFSLLLLGFLNLALF